ncbi:hypothetical protein [Bacillus nitratireducens]|uniref:hypothetical protein n=1 Tax=Bacillus nitratireducens TaxID=2026193 RepID=UPI002E1C3EAA|nr:hypothetical protein [Bacillus nitratireducens]
MDTLIIEYLACLEVNRMILQDPYHLVSEVQFNDRSPSFDGEIIIYNSDILKKNNIKGTVKIQIKGTTTHKRLKTNRKIKHPINKIDLEVYKKIGEGVLYLVVLINKHSKKMQTYYNALTPLDIERFLNVIKSKEQDSLSIDFKLLQEGALEQICKIQMENVKKQPSSFIELSKNKDFEKYKIEYTIISSEQKEFSFFENVGYVYGVDGEYEMPLEAMVADRLQINKEESIVIDGENISVRYHITESKNDLNIEFENTLIFEISKKTKTGKFNMKRLTSINSYIKACKILKYILENKKFPSEIYEIGASINKVEKFNTICEEIKQYEDLLETCKRIGISGDYVFNEKENSDDLFTGICNVFREQKYKLISGESKIDGQIILRLKLSEYITLLLFKDEKDNMFYNMFDEKIFQRLAAFIPKNPGEFNPNKDTYNNVSIYAVYKIREDLLSLTNFNFETYKKSFDNKRHDKGLMENNQIALDLISTYDECGNIAYLELAKRLLEDLIESQHDKQIQTMNLLQIKKRINQKLESEEENYLYDLLETTDNPQLKFVANVILGLKQQASRIFNRMDDGQQSEVHKWPIYNLYLQL